jgi:hypothetical protein
MDMEQKLIRKLQMRIQAENSTAPEWFYRGLPYAKGSITPYVKKGCCPDFAL